MKPDRISGTLSPFIKKLRIKAALKYLKSGTKILDIGCGFGEIIKYLQSNIKYTGIEKDEYLYNYCKNKYPEKNFIFGDAEEIINKLENDFDVILLLSILEHLKDPFEFLKIIKDHCKKEGKIIIYTPSSKAKIFLSFGAKLGIFSKIAEKEHSKLINSREIEDSLKLKGLKILKKKNFFFGLSYLIVFEK